jgi:two-component system chemotaxis response regulator CheY
MRAIVIDDSRAMRLILSRVATKLGFEVQEAGSGREALDVLGDREDAPNGATA